MKVRPLFVRSMIFWALLMAFMLAFQPATLPIILLIVPFALLFAAVRSSWLLLLGVWARYRGHVVSANVKRFGLTLIWVWLLLLILQSLGQLTLRDSLTVGAIALIGYLYVVRNRSLAGR